MFIKANHAINHKIKVCRHTDRAPAHDSTCVQVFFFACMQAGRWRLPGKEAGPQMAWWKE